jgi:uncharacterized protein YjiS (DUF1127 family)
MRFEKKTFVRSGVTTPIAVVSQASRAIAIPVHGTGFMEDVLAKVRMIWLTICEWSRRRRARRELRAMSQREIADFCPKLTDALNEADKPFWRP